MSVRMPMVTYTDGHHSMTFMGGARACMYVFRPDLTMFSRLTCKLAEGSNLPNWKSVRTRSRASKRLSLTQCACYRGHTMHAAGDVLIFSCRRPQGAYCLEVVGAHVPLRRQSWIAGASFASRGDPEGNVVGNARRLGCTSGHISATVIIYVRSVNNIPPHFCRDDMTYDYQPEQ